MKDRNKPTVWILDDQWRSALTKVSWFFNLTTASFSSTRAPEALDALKASLEAPGWALVPLQLQEVGQIKLRHGIVLIDVNWSAAPAGTRGLEDLSPQERDSYGLTIASQILAQRRPEDNLDIILFSHTKGDELTAYYFELAKKGIPQVHPVVILEKDSKGPRIRSYGWEALERITGNLLAKLSPDTRNEMARAIEARLGQQPKRSEAAQPEAASWQQGLTLDDFTPDCAALRVEGIALTDLAVPFFRKALAAGLDAGPDSAQDVATTQLKRWQALLVGERVAFELSDKLKNVPTALLRALLRYRELDHFDGFLHLQDIKGSRYVDPVGALRKNLEEDGNKLANAALHKGFKHQIQVNLGTPIRKMSENKPLGNTFTPFQKLPEVLKDPGMLSTSSSKKKEKDGPQEAATAKLHIATQGDTGFRLSIAPDTIWDNRELQASSRLAHFRSAPGDPVELLKILEIDPENLELCHTIAQCGENLRQRIAPGDERWETFLTSAQAALLRLKRAEANLGAYAHYLHEVIPSIGREHCASFERDITGWKERCERWSGIRQDLEALLAHFQVPANRGTVLAEILERTDTNAGLNELEDILQPLLPRARKYANTAIEKILQHAGRLNNERLAMARRGFAHIFPAANQDASRRNWLRLGIAALGPRGQEIADWPDPDFENKIIPLLGKEILQEIITLEGHDFLERLETIPDDDSQVEEDGEFYRIHGARDEQS